MPLALQSAFGFLAFILIAWLLSENRRAFPWRIVVAGALLQIALAALLLKVPLTKAFFFELNDALLALEKATQQGTRFVFGFLGGGEQPFEERPGTSSFVLAFRALPLMLVLSALTSLLFYWRILPAIGRRCPRCSRGRWASAERSAFRPAPTFSSGWWKRRSSCDPISRT
jgi:CNT family concentrative nucleoside transporter